MGGQPALASFDSLRDVIQELKRHRVERGWSQKTLADRAGIDQRTLLRWENGQHVPHTLAMLQCVAQALDLSLRISDQFLELTALWEVIDVVEEGDFRTVRYKRVRHESV